MGTLSAGTVLFGKTQRKLLAIFFTRPEETFYLRQVIRMAGGGQGAVQRELKQWVQAGLLIQTRQGNQVHYKANADLPIFSELKAIAVKTFGVAEVIRDALHELSGRIVLAFIHGSVAAGTEKADSDVDLIVVGSVSFGDVTSSLHGIQEQLGREINPSVYSPADFKQKLRAGHHFLGAVSAGAKIFLIGDEGGLDRLGA